VENPFAMEGHSESALLSVKNLRVEFSTSTSFLRRPIPLVAVDDVSFELRQGRTLGIVGESGSGKSTLARALLRLVPAAHGSAEFMGLDLLRSKGGPLRRIRRQVQMVFQDSSGSLNPRLRVGPIVAEPLQIHRILRGRPLWAKVDELLEAVGLPADAARRYPHEFSGGQRQRIGIARALALQPKLVVLDEPVSALDVSVQAQILNLLADLRERFRLTYLFITHNLAVVEHFCTEVAVMSQGRIVETGSPEHIFRQPAHPYTRALLRAAPPFPGEGVGARPARETFSQPGPAEPPHANLTGAAPTRASDSF
jgi:ABC-type glutathione transport system ATPase component